MTALNNVGMKIRRQALHVVRTACNKCNLLFEDKFYESAYSDHDASGKKSTGVHLVQCPYCDHINHISHAHYEDVKIHGQYRDFAEDCYYGTKYGPRPPLGKSIDTKFKARKVA